MSLINDALKRAKEAQQQNPTTTAEGPALRPAEPAQAQTGGGTKTLLYIMVACVVFGNALLFFAVGWKKETPQTSQPAPVPVASTTTTTPTTTTTTPVAAAPAPPAPASQPAIVETNPVPVSASVTGSNSPFAAPVVAVEPEPPKPAPLKLQSIIYNPSRPSAMISGKFLFIGDKVQGFRVTAIEQESVTLVGNGQTNTLSLP